MKTKKSILLALLLPLLSLLVGCQPPGLSGDDYGDDDAVVNGNEDTDNCEFSQFSTFSFDEASILIPDGEGTYLFAVTENEFAIVDVSDPSAPAVMAGDSGSFSSVGRAELYGDRLYLASASTMTVFDISDPTSDPPLVATISSGDYAFGAMAAGNDHIFIAGRATSLDEEGEFPLLVFPSEVTDDSTPTEYTQGTGHFTALARAGDRLYAGYAYHNYVQDNSLFILDISSPNAPSVVDEVGMPGLVIETKAIGNSLYVSLDVSDHEDPEFNLAIYDLEDPDVPNLTSSTLFEDASWGSMARCITAGGGLVYALDSYSLGSEGSLLVFDPNDDGSITTLRNVGWDEYYGLALDRSSDVGPLFLGNYSSVGIQSRCDPK